MHLDGWDWRETILSRAKLKDMPHHNPGGSWLFSTSEKTLSKWYLMTLLSCAGFINGLEEVQHGLIDSDCKYLVAVETPLPRKCRRLFHFGMRSSWRTARAHRIPARTLHLCPRVRSRPRHRTCLRDRRFLRLWARHRGTRLPRCSRVPPLSIVTVRRCQWRQGWLSHRRRGSHRCCWPRCLLALQWASKQGATTVLTVTKTDTAGRLGNWGPGPNAEAELRRRLRTWRHCSPVARDTAAQER